MKSTHNDLSSPGIGNCKDGKSEGGGRTSPFGSIAEPMSQSITPGKGKLSAQYTSINIPNPTEYSHIYSTCGTGNALPPQTAAVLKPWHIELMLLRSQKQTSTRELLSNSTAAVSHCILIYLHCTFGWAISPSRLKTFLRLLRALALIPRNTSRWNCRHLLKGPCRRIIHRWLTACWITQQ